MPIRTAPGTGLNYHLIAFDGEGRERTDDPDGLLSQRVVEVVGNEPITDVFLLSHGWKGDVPSAINQYDGWVGTMAQCGADVEQLRQGRPDFRPLIVGLHWPSLPWGEEALGGAAAFAATVGTTIEELVDQYAERLATTPAARAALETIFTAALDDVAPPTLPPAVRQAYAVLDHEAGLGSEGVGAEPGADREPFDPEGAYQAAMEDEAASFGGVSLGGLLSPLQQLSFWKMKDRARQFGERGGFTLLGDLQRAGSNARFHLMGHSFGCIVASAIVAGPGGHGELVRPVDSVVLVQGALSLWSYCADIPPAPGQASYFRSIVADRKVRGPIITTQTEFDTAVGRYYPLGAGVRGQVAFVPGELPKYGAVGTFGVRGPDTDALDLVLGPADAVYGFEPGRIYNLECSQYIRTGAGPSGAHGDFLHPEVAHAVWEAART